MFMLYKINCVLSVLLLSVAVGNSYAQILGGSDTSFVTKEVVIASERLSTFAVGSKIVEIDSSDIAQNSTNTLAELLASQSQILVKSYSLSGLASSSIRGMNASQTAILWNGFNLSSPMNGMQDMALLPVNFVNRVKVQYGGAGALWGSGAIGGSIHLNNKPEFNKGFSLGSTFSVGSFNDRQENISLEFSKNKFISSTKCFQHQAQNNYPYTNVGKYGKPVELLQNAQIAQSGLLQENYLKLTDNQNVSVRLWLQNNSRHIPASMTSSLSKAIQVDQSLRLTAEWQSIQKKVSYFSRVAYFNENFQYTDPAISLNSVSNTSAFIAETEAKISVSLLHTLNVGVNNTYNKALTQNYSFSPTRNRISFFGSYLFANKASNFKTTCAVRQEIVGNGSNPFTFSLGSALRILRNMRLRGSVTKNYRIPTFNDLYWAQGGNPNLLPENGYSEEIALGYMACKNNFAIEYETAVFNSNVQQWIMWIPNHVGIWSPENVQKVWSRGLENDVKIYYTLAKVKFNAGFHYQYILTTAEEIATKEQSSIHKQLPYTPTEKAIFNVGVHYRNFKAQLNYNYVGYRYTTTDNTQFLAPFATLGLDLSKSITVKNCQVTAFFQANNLSNVAYQMIAYFATPGRSFQFGLSINFNKPNPKP